MENKKNKAEDSLDKIKENTSEEKEIWFKANLDYIGRSYSIYLYALLVVGITSTTYLFSNPKTVVNINQQVNILDFTLSLGSITINVMYSIIFTWVVYWLALDFLAHRYVNKYNQILLLYYSKKSTLFIERRMFISEYFKYPAKLLALISIPLLEKSLAILRKLK